MNDPKFSKQMAMVMNSPYFYRGEGLERIDEKLTLQSQLTGIESIDELPDEAKQVVQRAMQSLKKGA